MLMASFSEATLALLVDHKYGIQSAAVCLLTHDNK